MRSLSVLVDQLRYLVFFSAVVTQLETNADDEYAFFAQIHNAICQVPSNDGVVDPIAGSANEGGIMDVEPGTDIETPSPPCCGFCETSADCLDHGSCCLEHYGSFEAAKSAVRNTRYECVRPSIFISNFEKTKPTSTFENVWMVTKCSDETENYEPYYRRCTTMDTNDYFNSVVPVTFHNVTYRNKFCANCNGVHESQTMATWEMAIGCGSSISPTDDDIYGQLVEGNCSLQFNVPDKVDARLCESPGYSISVCNITGLWPVYDQAIELACQSFVDPFNQTYQNYFCYICNTDQPQVPEQWYCPPIQGEPNAILPPFIALINLDVVQQWRKDETLDCNIVNQFQDKKKMLCRDIECDGDLRLVGETCLREYNNPEVDLPQCYLVKIAIKLVPNGKTFLSDSDLQDENFPWDIFNAFQPLASTFVYINNFVIYAKSNFLAERIVVEYFVVHVEIDLRYDWYKSLSSVLDRFHNVKMDVYKTKGSISFASELVAYNETDSNVSPLYFTGSHNGTADELAQYFRLNNASVNSACKDITFHKLLFCPFVQVPANEMSIKIKNGFLIVDDLFPSRIFSNWEYAVRNDTILYCIDEFRLIYEGVAWPEIQSSTGVNGFISTSRIVSFICVCISIACLFITICTYIGTPKLRTQPGISNVILSVSLLLAQTLYQFGAGQTSLSYIACSVIGALCHFFWLCVMFSMNACSVQMFNIFRQKVRLSPIFNWKTSVKTVVYVMCSSVSFVIINLVVSLLTSDGKRSGYVGDICYLSDSLMHLTTFIIPAAITLSINIILFAYVVFVIRKSSYSASAINQDRNYFGIYARLSTLTGITWSFGYLHLFFESKIIEYLFIVFNGCQGVFIMMAFVLKRGRCSVFSRKSA